MEALAAADSTAVELHQRPHPLLQSLGADTLCASACRLSTSSTTSTTGRPSVFWDLRTSIAPPPSSGGPTARAQQRAVSTCKRRSPSKANPSDAYRRLFARGSPSSRAAWPANGDRRTVGKGIGRILCRFRLPEGGVDLGDLKACERHAHGAVKHDVLQFDLDDTVVLAGIECQAIISVDIGRNCAGARFSRPVPCPGASNEGQLLQDHRNRSGKKSRRAGCQVA